MIKKINTTKIFSKTVAYYDKSRPSYPKEVFDFLKNMFDLNISKVIADIGSGTGIFTQLLLERNYQVISIEPNDDMRKVAEQKLSKYQFFKSIAAPAELTTLDDKSIDVITVATAFHWFNRELVKNEFKRILKPEGLCVLIWNICWSIKNVEFPIMQDYDLMMRDFLTKDIKVVTPDIFDNQIKEFFAPNDVSIKEFPNVQILDLEGFKDRVLSNSFSPKPGDDNYSELMIKVEEIFNKYQTNDLIKFYYNCKCYVGKL